MPEKRSAAPAPNSLQQGKPRVAPHLLVMVLLCQAVVNRHVLPCADESENACVPTDTSQHAPSVLDTSSSS